MGTSSSQKRRHSPHPIFPCLLWSNGWMDQDATWYRGKSRPRRRCFRWGCSSPIKGAQPPVFGSCLFVAKRLDEDATRYGSRSRPRPHFVRRGHSSPVKAAQQPVLFSAHVYCGHGRPSQLLLSSCFVLHSSRQSVPILYNGPPLPLKMSLPMGNIDPI